MSSHLYMLLETLKAPSPSRNSTLELIATYFERIEVCGKAQPVFNRLHNALRTFNNHPHLTIANSSSIPNYVVNWIVEYCKPTSKQELINIVVALCRGCEISGLNLPFISGNQIKFFRCDEFTHAKQTDLVKSFQIQTRNDIQNIINLVYV